MKRRVDRVAVTASASAPDRDWVQIVNVTLTIDPGWEIYANPPGQEDLIPLQTTTAVRATEKVTPVTIDYPRGKLTDSGLLGKIAFYQDKVQIRMTVRRTSFDSSPLIVTVSFYPTDGKTCGVLESINVRIP
jgi:DsbC/DsbD-like thiol-disulfide interchange protein